MHESNEVTPKMVNTVKYDWYQADSTVTVTVLLKNAADKNYSVTFQEKEVLLKADGIEPLAINLWDGINVAQSTHKATPNKVEIKLAKLNGPRWPTLEKQEAVVPVAGGCGGAHPKKHNWDNWAKDVEKEEAKEAEEGDAAAKEFADGDDDTKWDMTKLYYESGKTTMSWDRNKVGKRTGR